MHEGDEPVATKARLFHPAALVGLTVLCVAASSVAIYGVYWSARLDSADVASHCKVIEVGVREIDGEHGDRPSRGTRYVPEVTLAHEVDGERYEREDAGAVQSLRSEAEHKIAGLHPGADVACRYVEGRPDLVVYFEERTAPLAFYVIGFVFLFIGLSAHALEIRTRLRARRRA
jgi:hypothetical protein